MKFSVPCLLVALAAVAVLEETAVEALRTVPTSTHRIVASSLAVPRGGDLSSYAAKLEAVKDAVLSSTVASVSLVVLASSVFYSVRHQYFGLRQSYRMRKSVETNVEGGCQGRYGL